MFYTQVRATYLPDVKVGVISPSCFKWMGLQEPNSPSLLDEAAQILSGNRLLEGSDPVAHVYCGHQFGAFSGQLGDGRAITLGDTDAVNGELIELNLKGAGLTPFSRQGDGRAVLRSSIREFLCSEAMYGLGIPTTRAASLIVSEKTVTRDKMYQGFEEQEKCAVVLRVAPNFIRFGSFEIFKEEDSETGREGPSVGLKNQMMPKLLDYLWDTQFSKRFQNHIVARRSEKYKLIFQEIVKTTAETIALWQCYGFCHGVLNTDNMSVLGLTIDFGPFAWMEHFDPNFICNHSDKGRGRYRFNS